MNIFISIINRFFRKNTINPLGRWNIDYCSITLNRKIDLSNEDHCGPCGDYLYVKNINNIPININQKSSP